MPGGPAPVGPKATGGWGSGRRSVAKSAPQGQGASGVWGPTGWVPAGLGWGGGRPGVGWRETWVGGALQVDGQNLDGRSHGDRVGGTWVGGALYVGWVGSDRMGRVWWESPADRVGESWGGGALRPAGGWPQGPREVGGYLCAGAGPGAGPGAGSSTRGSSTGAQAMPAKDSGKCRSRSHSSVSVLYTCTRPVTLLRRQL